ncbi:MAG: anti-sigma factor antagonist [Ruminiclostridium sp.]|nr:anti-sigma factor antagonist [Ruminiclostridium sp.]
MSGEFDIEKLREEVNPVYNTAQSCMQIVAGIGDEDSENLRKKLGFCAFGEDTKEKEVKIPPQILNALMSVIPIFKSLVESRFFASNKYFTESGAKNVVDLPCGYTARGVKLAKSGLKFYGFDLPAVIDAMKPAVKEAIGDNENIIYHEVDATNYASLRKALEGAKGELHITTEGLLMYLTQSEIETVFGNIRKLLLEFGGKWVTVDNELDLAQTKALTAALAGMPPELVANLGNIGGGSMAKTTLENNIFFDKDREKAKKFVSDMGFDLELVSMKKYLPDPIVSLKDLPKELAEKAAEAFGEVNFWVMTPKPGTVEEFTCKEDNFNADVKLSDDILNVALTGRLDTITSPGLLALYKDAEAKGKITSICVDMKELEYISSAGLRVLMIMRKALDDGNNFSIVNMNDQVREIFETTGFDTIFC